MRYAFAYLVQQLIRVGKNNKMSMFLQSDCHYGTVKKSTKNTAPKAY